MAIEKLKQDRLNKLEKIKELGINPYPYSYNIDSNSKILKKKYDDKIKEHKQTKDFYKIAGRIILFRNMGNLTFSTIQDEDDEIQIVFMKKNLNETKQKLLKFLDLGDIIGVYGNIFKTKKGELSILVKDFDILCKSLSDLGDKFHGICDVEKKYRNRSLDMITNSNSKKILKKRFLITQKIREFFIKKGFLEIETPITQINYGGAMAKPFKTYHNSLDLNLYLRVAPEQSLKKVMVGGMEAIFEINKNFRNEDIDTTHNPEFTMLEAYKSYVDYEYMMKICEELVEFCSMKLYGTTKIEFMGKKIDVKSPWKRITIKDALQENTKWDLDKMSDKDLFNEVKKLKKETFHKTRGEAILILFEKYAEKKYIQPIHFIDYPKEATIFCKKKRGDKNLIERFESFICGMEISNAYSELNDGKLQRKLIEQQIEFKKKGADEIWGESDEEFLDSMDLGLPPAAGIGIGIDRLVMVLLNQKSIRDIIYFPTTKPKNIEKKIKTKIAVALININIKENWKKLNTIAHLSSSFSARIGKGLFFQDEIKTKENEKIKLNIQHAILIKSINSNKEIIELKKKARKLNLEISEFTQEMIDTTNDKKVIEMTKNKNLNEIKYLGILVFGDKKKVDEITKDFSLYK